MTTTIQHDKVPHMTFKERYEASYLENLTKRIEKKTQLFPPDAKTIYYTANGDKDMRLMCGMGWEVHQAPTANAFRTVVNQWVMKKDRD